MKILIFDIGVIIGLRCEVRVITRTYNLENSKISIFGKSIHSGVSVINQKDITPEFESKLIP